MFNFGFIVFLSPVYNEQAKVLLKHWFKELRQASCHGRRWKFQCLSWTRTCWKWPHFKWWRSHDVQQAIIASLHALLEKEQRRACQGHGRAESNTPRSPAASQPSQRSLKQALCSLPSLLPLYLPSAAAAFFLRPPTPALSLCVPHPAALPACFV